MSLQAPKTITDIFTANSIPTPFVIALMQCQELALAVNLQRKYAVQLETSQHGIFCDTWLAERNAQHESHCQLSCFYTQQSATRQIFQINAHLTVLLHGSAGDAR